MAKTPFISVVIPCYNEEANLKKEDLKKVYGFLSAQNFTWEVVISNDGSTDKSAEIVKSQIKNFRGFKLLNNPHGGKPQALKYGINFAKGEYVLFADMDQSTPISELPKLLKYAKGDYGAIIGSRGMDRKDFPFYRKLGSKVFAGFRKTMLLRQINDTQCGFKLFKRSIVAKAFPMLEFFKTNTRTKGWQVTSYDVELLHIISKMGHKIKEVVVDWRDEDVSESKGGGVGRYIRESREMLTQILRVKLNDIKGVYKISK